MVFGVCAMLKMPYLVLHGGGCMSSLHAKAVMSDIPFPSWESHPVLTFGGGCEGLVLYFYNVYSLAFPDLAGMWASHRNRSDRTHCRCWRR